MRYYFGGLASDTAADPVAAGLLAQQGNRIFIYPARLDDRHPGLREQIRRHVKGGTITWDALAAVLDESYYRARKIPSSLAALQARWPYRAWLRFDVDGPMTRARRRVYVAEDAMRSALAGYLRRGRHLLYPVGTAIVAEHYHDGDHVESTAMIRRGDGFWDFVTYRADGQLAEQTQALPKALATPRQCLGCHLGRKAFEPERSFPLHASPGPDGPRAYYVDDALRDGDVTQYFSEHRKRSDTVLGIYGTLYAAQLRASRRRGGLTEADRSLLRDLGL